jgi:hypothetical protein
MDKEFSEVIVLMFTTSAFHFLGAEVFMLVNMETAYSSGTHLSHCLLACFFFVGCLTTCPVSRLKRMDGRMTDGRIGKDLEGSGLGLIEVLLQYPVGRTEETTLNLRTVLSQPRFKPSNLQIIRITTVPVKI